MSRDNRGGRESSFDKRAPRGEIDNRRERAGAGERRPASVRQSRDRENDWSSTSSKTYDGPGKEGDFFDSLMSELSNDLRDGRSDEKESRTRGGRSHDYAGPNAKVMEKSRGAEDSFFENLMSELGGALDEPSSSPSGKVKSQRTLDDDDFFSSLEAELSQSLGADYGSGIKQEKDEYSNDDDFFASLEKEMGKALISEKADDEEMQDDFFSNLMKDVANDLESPRKKQTETERRKIVSPLTSLAAQESGSIQASTNDNGDLSSLTVPELKDLLRRRGLKVGGNKTELINRLQSQS